MRKCARRMSVESSMTLSFPLDDKSRRVKDIIFLSAVLISSQVRNPCGTNATAAYLRVVDLS